MTNEQLASKIKAGDQEMLLTLWKQVERFAYQQGRRWVGVGRAKRLAQAETSGHKADFCALDRRINRRIFTGWGTKREGSGNTRTEMR